MEPGKQQVLRAKPLLTIAVISIFFLLLGGCGKEKANQEFITEHNLKILDTVIKKVCYRWKRDSLKKDYQLHLINYSDKSFKNVFDQRIIKSLKVDPEYTGIFTEDNIEFFKEQLDTQPQDYYTNLLPRNDCYLMKNEIYEEEHIPSPLFKPQEYFISKIVFTRDFEYALFVAGKVAFGLDIYKRQEDLYRPYKSVYLYIH